MCISKFVINVSVQPCWSGSHVLCAGDFEDKTAPASLNNTPQITE